MLGIFGQRYTCFDEVLQDPYEALVVLFVEPSQ